MQQVRKKSKELDHYLKSVISAVPKKLDNFIEGSDKTMTYYTGNWATDVMNNFTENAIFLARNAISLENT